MDNNVRDKNYYEPIENSNNQEEKINAKKKKVIIAKKKKSPKIEEKEEHCNKEYLFLDKEKKDKKPVEPQERKQNNYNYELLENKIREYEKNLKEKNATIQELNKKIKNYDSLIKQYSERENNWKKKEEESKLNLEKLNNEIQAVKNYNLEEKEKLEKDPLEFYDIIGNINSIQNVKIDGWEFFMNEEGFKISNSGKNEERLVIGVMGNRNKGKSFMLQALSGASMKTGTTINTIGLSIKYLDNKYVLLDCAGSESPLLGENANMLEISRDKLFTEAFLESYILRKSNVILLVVGILSFSEQKLINKISKDLEKLKNKEKKNLVVIHNLQTYEEVDDVEKYINETLLKSASFKIKKDESNFGNEKDTSEFFYDIDNTSVKHFIYAKENSEAGKKYNQHTINSIKSLYRISTSKYKYDYKETIIEHFKYMSEKMFDINGNVDLELSEVKENNENNKENQKDKNEINNNDKANEVKNVKNVEEFKLIDKKFIKYSYKLKYIGEEKLSLQKMVIDELGISSFIHNDFTPNLEMYYNEQELTINIECPEGTEITAKRKRNKNKNTEYPFCIEIIAEKAEESKKENVTYIKNKQSGKFRTLIPFSNSNYSIGKGKEDKLSNGWKSFIFPLSKIEDDDD